MTIRRLSNVGVVCVVGISAFLLLSISVPRVVANTILFPEKTRFEEELLSLQDDDKSAADDAAQSLLPICVSDHQLAPSTPFGVSDAGQNKMGGLPWFDPSDVPFSSEQLVEDQEDLD